MAGEVSGDLLGAGLMRALRTRMPGLSFEGIGGPQMQTLGCRSLFPMEKLSIIGLEDVNKYADILRIRNRLIRHFLSSPPDLFVGIDVPDFNLGLEEKLKSAGIPTIHYVSPTVWAWRRYRIRKIRRAVDHMLTLFPFEAKFYRQYHVPVTFVGHPLADSIFNDSATDSIRKRLLMPEKKSVIALLPGSRISELNRHADLFVKTAIWLSQRYPNVHFIVPLVSDDTKAIFEKSLFRCGGWFLPLTIVVGQSREAMMVSEVIILASGTATLEAALLKKPMVVTYRMSWFSYFLIRPFLHVQLYALPNILAGRELVPELIQHEATPEKLGEAVGQYLTRRDLVRATRKALAEIQRLLRRNANVRAAEAVIKMLRPRRIEKPTV